MARKIITASKKHTSISEKKAKAAHDTVHEGIKSKIQELKRRLEAGESLEPSESIQGPELIENDADLPNSQAYPKESFHPPRESESIPVHVLREPRPKKAHEKAIPKSIGKKSGKLDLRKLDIFGLREKEYNQKVTATFAHGKRVATGIPGMDQMIEGGFVQGSVNLIAGDTGTGKSTFAMQYLYNGAVKFNEPGVYLTFEEKKDQIMKNCLRYGWDLKKLEEDGKLAILQYPPHDIGRFILEGEIIEDTLKDMGAKRLVIDSITSLALIFETEYKRKIGIIRVLDLLRKWGATTLLTSEAKLLDGGEIRPRFGLGFLADSLIQLYNVRQGDQRQKALEIIKMRGVAHSQQIVPFDFKENGIMLYPNQPVFGGMDRR